jgi:hypothetical protein
MNKGAYMKKYNAIIFAIIIATAVMCFYGCAEREPTPQDIENLNKLIGNWLRDTDGYRIEFTDTEWHVSLAKRENGELMLFYEAE